MTGLPIRSNIVALFIMIGLRGGHVTQASQSEFLCEICDAGDGGVLLFLGG